MQQAKGVTDMASWWRNIATFKGKFTEAFTKDKIEELVDEIKKLIEKYEEYKSLSGKEKKQRVDEFIVEWLIENWQSDNDYVQWIIDRIIDLVPVFTQVVYNLLITKFVKLKDRAKTEKAEDK